MGYEKDKEKLERNRGEAHRRYMLHIALVKDTQEDIEILQKRLVELKALTPKLKSRRDRLDEEWQKKFADEEKNKKRVRLEKLKAELEKLEADLA